MNPHTLNPVDRMKMSKYQIVRIKYTIAIAVIVFGGLYFWISGPSRNAQKIKPGTTIETVLKILGEPQEKEKMSGITIYYFRANLGAAGPIKVGFDKNNKAVYLKIWEDIPPQWDLISK